MYKRTLKHFKEAHENYFWEGEGFGYRSNTLHFLYLYFFTTTYTEYKNFVVGPGDEHDDDK